MANEHLVLCEAAQLTSRQKEWREAPVLRLRIGRGRGDVHVHIEHIARKMGAGVPDVATDLIEIASFVYAADQVVRRGGTREFDYGRRWRRRFRFEVPVRCLEQWERRDVQQALAETLGTLADETYEFGFVRRKDPPALTSYLYDGTAVGDAAGYEEVALFSGGQDSLGGAVQEVLQGQRKVALVSHRPVNKLLTRQRDLVVAIEDRLADRRLRPLHVPVEVNKGKRLGGEFTQRTRSFLFASFAAVVARLFGLRRIRFYENGVTSLNLPISPQLLGGRASRTTHPQVLQHFGRLFSLLFDGDFAVENPFLWKTKAEVLAQIKAAGHASLCARTISCWHTLQMTPTQPHCGRCSQCLDRRLSALAAGLDDGADPPEFYASDVLTDAREGTDLTLIERYVGNARHVDQLADAHQFLQAFPEVTRVLPHVGLPADRALELVFDLSRRHARQVRETLGEVVRAHALGLVRQEYPPNSLVALAGAPARSAGTAVQPSDPGNRPGGEVVTRRLELVKEMFEARYAGRSCPLGNTKEYWLLERLSRRPGWYISVDTLREDVWQDAETEKNTIQRTVSNLRRKLRDEHLGELLIDGQQKGHYRLILPS